MPSKKANRVGTRAEIAAAREYRLTRDGVHTSWCDAQDRDGTPVEIKATDAGRDYPAFLVYRKYHRALQQKDGHYVFVLYRRRGTGIQALKMKRIHSSKLPGSTWTSSGGHRDSDQRKVRPAAVFG